ncbi:MAG: ABC transporter ATP-binding protein [Chloroflexota bacterium]
MTAPTFAIETHHLQKVYGDVVAVKDLSLQIEPGEVFGFLGPNGAGKTTAVKMLLGLITPTAGEGRLLGATLGDRLTRARIGFLPEHLRFHDWLTASEFLTFHASLYSMSPLQIKNRVQELLELVGLRPHANKALHAFSKGMLQRIGLAQALLNEPELVLLDEPTSGLDPVGRRLVRDIIRQLRERGATVFLNSHFLSEVEITCDRVAFIKNGEVVHAGVLKTLLDGAHRVEIRARNMTPEILSGLSRWSETVRMEGERIYLTVEVAASLAEINRYLVERGAEVFTLAPQQVSLEDLFIQIVGTDGGL